MTLIERLRELQNSNVLTTLRLIAGEAADAIEALQAENELLKGYRDRSLELATAYNNAQENIEQINTHREHILDVNDKLQAERDALAAKLVPLTDSACAAFAKEYLEAWEDGMAGDSYLRRMAEDALKLDAANGGQHEDA
jgi:predicted nuclease with TOPRIM domain